MNKRVIGRVLLFLIAIAAGLYAIDEIVARVRPQGAVEVSVFYAVVRKDNRVDYSRADPQMEPCVNSAMPHMGLRACWYLVGHPKKEIDVGTQKNEFWRF